MLFLLLLVLVVVVVVVAVVVVVGVELIVVEYFYRFEKHLRESEDGCGLLIGRRSITPDLPSNSSTISSFFSSSSSRPLAVRSWGAI